MGGQTNRMLAGMSFLFGMAGTGCTAVTSFGDYEVIDGDAGVMDAGAMDGATDGGTDATVDAPDGTTFDGGMDAGDDAGGVCVPEAEICDGVDNDCDGVVDNGLTFVATESPVSIDVAPRVRSVQDARLLRTPAGLVVVYASLEDDDGLEEDVGYYSFRVREDLSIASTVVRAMSYRHENALVHAFDAKAFGDGFAVTFREGPTEDRTTIRLMRVEGPDSSPPTLGPVAMVEPVPTSPAEQAAVATTSTHVAVVEHLEGGGRRLAVFDQGLEQLSGARVVAPGSFPFVANDRIYLASTAGGQVRIAPVRLSETAPRVTVESSVSMFSGEMVRAVAVQGDEAFFAVRSPSSANDVGHVRTVPTFGCEGDCEGVLTSNEVHHALYDGGRWMVSAYGTSGGRVFLTGFDETLAPLEGLDVGRDTEVQGTAHFLSLEGGAFGMVAGQGGRTSSRLYLTRYHCEE